MSDGSDRPPDIPQAKPERRSKGQGLVEAFRAARIARRPALHSELRDSRLTLRQDRVRRLRGTVESGDASDVHGIAADMSTAAPAADVGPVQEPSASIFATYCGTVHAASQVIELAEPEALTPPPAAEAIGTEMRDVAMPLSAIGFGPGMTIRMSQLGIETVSQLAATDRDWLRTELGDLSQLVHVDVWIEAARKACAQP